MHRCAKVKSLVGLFVLLITARAIFSADKVDFAKDVHPILKNHCLACHTHGQDKGELRLDTVELMLKGGESGPAIVRGDSDKSLLYRMVAGKEETVMPPKKNKVGATPLKNEQIKILQRWIDEGANGPAAPIVANNEPIVWRTLPAGLNPIHAVAVSPGGDYAACGRGNQLFVYNLASGATVARLVDPALVKGDSPASPLAADRDLIMAMAFSPDGTQLATGGYRCIRLWRQTPQAPLMTLDSGETAFAAVSADGKWIATAAGNNIKLWDAASGSFSKELSGHSGAVRGLAFSFDNTKLLSGAADKNLRVWTLTDGQSVAVDAGAEINAVAWAAEGKTVAAGCADKIVRLWKVPEAAAAWEKPRELKAHAGPVTALSTVWPGGKHICSGSQDGTVRVWDSESGGEVRKLDHGAPVTAVAVQRDGKRFASAGGNMAKVWREKGELAVTLKGDRRAQDAQAEAERTAAFTKEQVAYFKKTIQDAEKSLATDTEAAKKAVEKAQAAVKEATAKGDAAKKAADAKAELEKSQAGPLAEITKAADARAAAEKAFAEAGIPAKAANDKVAQLKKARESKKDDAKLAAELGAAEKVAAEAGAKLKQAEDAKNAAAKTYTELSEKNKDGDSKLKAAQKVFTEADQAARQAAQARSAAEQNQERLDNEQKKTAQELADAKAALAATEAEQKSADAALEAAKKAAADSEKPLRALALSPDGELLAASGDDRIIHTWNTESGKGGEQIRNLEQAPVALAYLPDNRLLAAAAGKSLVYRADAEWKLERVIGTGGVDSPLIDRVLTLAYSPNGKLLVSGGGIPVAAGELKFWNPADGALVREIKDPHSDTVFGVAFSRDGKRLASCGADKLVKIFDPASGKLLKTFEGHTQHALCVSWNRHGRLLYSAGADKVVKIWDLVTGEQRNSVDGERVNSIISGFKKEVTGVFVLDAQNEILVASGDSQMRTVKENGSRVRNFQAGKDYIEAAGASANGKVIAAGGSDSVLRIFDASKEKPMRSFEPPKDDSVMADSVAKPAK